MAGGKKRRIVDAHHHLWDLDACHYPWLMARGVRRFFGDPTAIQKDYLVDDLRADANAYDLIGSVHIQVGVAPGDEVKETRWLQETADATGLPSAIVAYCDLHQEDAPDKLEQQGRFPLLRGIRQIVGRSAEEDAKSGSGALLNDPIWRENLRLLPERGLTFDLQLIPNQLTRAAEVLADVPGLEVALCHAGSPWDQSASGLARWRDGLRLVAQLPGSVCKLSGFGMFDHRWTTDSVRPMIDSCLDIFGVERCLFGSNFPVDKLHASYARVFGAYEAVTAGLDERDRERIFVDNARRFYRIA